MSDIDQTPDHPTINEEVEFWQSVDFPRNPARYPMVEMYLNELQKRYANGRVLFSSFLISPHHVSDWVMRDPKGMLFFRRFWHAPTPKETLVDLNISPAYENDPPFIRQDSFIFAGELASTLFHGGAYYYSQGSGAEEMKLSESVAGELIQDRYSDVQVYVNPAAWSDYFYDVIWDSTWLLIDRSRRFIHILCATDTD